MAKDRNPATEVIELDSSQRQPSESDPVVKIGHRPTIPRTLDRLIALIGVNSSVVCPWPNFYMVATLNLANGGTAGLLVGTIIACIGMTPVYLSLAEKMRKYATQKFLNLSATSLMAPAQISNRRRPVSLGSRTGASKDAKMSEFPLLLHSHLHMAIFPRRRSLALWSGYHCHSLDSHWGVPRP